MSSIVIRVSVIRCDPSQFERLRTMMVDAEPVLRPGIEALPGLLAFYAGEDVANSALINTSFWETLEQAHQLDRFQPMLDLGKDFVAAGARFYRPIMNHSVLWDFGPTREPAAGVGGDGLATLSGRPDPDQSGPAPREPATASAAKPCTAASD